jgi:hypothetical protein
MCRAEQSVAASAVEEVVEEEVAAVVRGVVMRTIRVSMVGSVVAAIAILGPVAHDVGRGPAVAEATVSSSEPNPVVTGPITGGLHGRPWFAAPFDPSDHGYTEEEFFFSGTAKAYGASKAPARYATRMLVYRPSNPAAFSGNVLVEWNNVTGQADAPVDFTWLARQVLAGGDAYVQITAQQAGVCGTGLTGQPILSLGRLSVAACTPISIKGYHPVHYAPLVHPGDAYSYDIFSQAAQAILNPQGVSPLGPLAVRHAIAIGESQSAIELDLYIQTGADAAAALFDGFLIDADFHDVVFPASYRVPTLHLWGEESAQPVSSTDPNHVIWQVAGAPHIDSWGLQHLIRGLTGSLLNLPRNTPQQQAAFEQSLGNYGQQGPGLSATCAGDTQFPRRYAVDAALSDLTDWVQTGTPAPSPPPLVFTGLAEATQSLPPLGLSTGLPLENLNALAVATSPLGLVRDANGNAVGGLRLPVITVPVASYHGSLCVLLGTSTPLLPAQLVQLYPTHDDYVTKMVTATQTAVESRYMTVADGIDLLQRACASDIPAWGTTPVDQQPSVCHDLENAVA